jgi:hypothetical protein
MMSKIEIGKKNRFILRTRNKKKVRNAGGELGAREKGRLKVTC